MVRAFFTGCRQMFVRHCRNWHIIVSAPLSRYWVWWLVTVIAMLAVSEGGRRQALEMIEGWGFAISS